MNQSNSSRILRLAATEAKVGLKRDNIYRLARLGRFPKPIKISERASGWLEHELEDFIARRAAQRNAPEAIEVSKAVP